MSNKDDFFKKIGKSLTSNIGIKILAFVMALFLFFIVHAAC